MTDAVAAVMAKLDEMLIIRTEGRVIPRPRFALTLLGKQRFPKLKDAGGVVVSESRDGKRWVLLFDHRKTKDAMHKSFIRLVPRDFDHTTRPAAKGEDK